MSTPLIHASTTGHPRRCAWRMTQIGAPIAKARAMRQSQIRSSQRGMVKTLIVALFLLLPAPALAQNGTILPFITQFFTDASGNPLSSGKLCTYAAGGSTPQATYSDVTLSTANANPVILSSNGRPTSGAIFLSGTSYKFELRTAGTDQTCATGTILWTLDNVSAVPTSSNNVDFGSQVAGEALAAGDVVYLSDGSGGATTGRWYKADADNTYSSTLPPMVGIAPSAIASGATGTIRAVGRATGLSGLTAGATHYVSATAGALTATPPANARIVGRADSTTTLDFAPNPGPNFVTLSATGNTTLGDAAADTVTVTGTITSNLIATDNTYDIGASGATRFRDLFLARNAAIGGTLGLTGVGTFTAAPVFSSTTASRMLSVDASKNLVGAAVASSVLLNSLTDPTGTGVAVFGTAPTFTTSIATPLIIGNTTTNVIRTSTSDGADNGFWSITGGGASGTSRGGELFLYGNESSRAGDIHLALGNVAGSELSVTRADGTEVLEILGTDGSTSFTGSRQLLPFTFRGTETTDSSNTIVVGISTGTVNTGTATILLNFSANGSNIGNVDMNNNAVAYNTSSDVRLKNLFGRTTRGGDVLRGIDVYDATWKADPQQRVMQMFAAQQLYPLYPEAVSVGGDDPLTRPWSVEYGRLTPLLVTGWQEHDAAIQALTAENAALRARLDRLEALLPRRPGSLAVAAPAAVVH